MGRSASLCVAITLLGLTACATAKSEPSAATPLPIPTPTMDPNAQVVPLTELNLAPFLIWPGDLPVGMSGGLASPDYVPPHEYYEELPKPDNEAHQVLDRDGKRYGSVSLFLYKSSDGRAKAYDLMTGRFPAPPNPPHSAVVAENKPLASVGEEGTLATVDGPIERLVNLGFVRCNVVVFIGINEPVRILPEGWELLGDGRYELPPPIDPDRTMELLVAEAISYAKQLDGRLAQVACR